MPDAFVVVPTACEDHACARVQASACFMARRCDGGRGEMSQQCACAGRCASRSSCSTCSYCSSSSSCGMRLTSNRNDDKTTIKQWMMAWR